MMNNLEAGTRTNSPSMSQMETVRDDLTRHLAECGIKVAIGIGCTAEGGPALSVLIQPEHGLTSDQIQEVKAIQSHLGIPVQVRLSQSIIALEEHKQM